MGKKPKDVRHESDTPNIVAQQGTVEDWIIENRSQELHAFHIHQLHFLLLDYMGSPVHENFLRDTVNVPYYNGHLARLSQRPHCASISATPISSAPSPTTAIFSNTKIKA